MTDPITGLDPMDRAKHILKSYDKINPFLDCCEIKKSDLQWLIDRIETLEKQMELLLSRGGKIPFRYFAKRDVDYFREEMMNARELLENKVADKVGYKALDPTTGQQYTIVNKPGAED